MKQNYFYPLLIFILTLIIVSQISCSNNSHHEMNERDLLQFNKIHDSLVATGEHGYYATVFIVGRIRSTPLFNGNPFNIKVLKIDPELLEKKINLKFLDSTKYSVAYTKNKVEKILTGVFDKKLADENIEIAISKVGSFIDSTNLSTIETLKTMAYLFEVYSY